MQKKSSIRPGALLIAALTLCLSPGCKKSDGGELLVTPKGAIALAAGGETKNIAVTAEGGGGWSVSVTGNDDDWLEYQATDNSLSLTARPNTGLDARKATVRIALRDDSASETLTLSQNAITRTIALAPSSLPEFPREGAEQRVVVTYSDFVELKVDAPAWATLGAIPASGGELSITVTPNSGAARTGSILFSDAKGHASSVRLSLSQSGEAPAVDPNDPLSRGYLLTAQLSPESSHIGLGYNDQVWNKVHNDMKTHGWDYSENPNIAGAGTGDHTSEAHIAVEQDKELGQPVYRFFSHSHQGAIDGDRKAAVGGNRMRNEMRGEWRTVNGNYGEWQVLQWKMKIPRGWAPTTSFCHLHQLKGVEGSNIKMPVITLSLRADAGGGRRRLEVIHIPRDESVTNKIVDDPALYALEKFEGEWLQVQTEAHFQRLGYYRIRISRVRDGQVLMDREFPQIDLWRTGGCVNVRNKFGIYRSYNLPGNLAEGQLPNLKDEELLLTDFKVYEKESNNSNPTSVND